MDHFKNILAETKDGILYLTINREDKMNALNFATLEELREVFDTVLEDKSIKAVILTGAGEKAFVAGADISEIAELNEVNARKFAENGQEIFSVIENCEKPVIAVTNGFTLGGGCELAMACHMRIASANARFGQPEVNLGIIPGYGGTQRLTILIGRGKANELMMTGDMINAEDARSLGLVNHVLPTKGEAMAKAEEILHKIMSKAPLAIGMIVDCVNAVYRSDENGYQTEANSFARCVKSGDYKEGTSAFLEKRKPVFKGE
ncbi:MULTISPECIES: enoyl-CoA hydratase/isomerase family protein [Algoriphagus]|jgi:enoyl-CoA hydratase|uniref:Enoyl-CoA hydratase/isomerase family protein n=2 Tax=Algoriphagus TaxID=246875 RepID=A0ABS7N846_9BACT|nr:MULTISPECIES: enoyl-CoA hydratase-related protein [Algoriphagus]MBY5952500.1 enoyl-CoA hydratase/isomerase family protein [Algoriphagus marincola]TDK44932.1 enoyl-CoA hydratase [Algoriphagus aquimaris]